MNAIGDANVATPRERERRRLVRLHRYEDAARANGHRLIGGHRRGRARPARRAGRRGRAWSSTDRSMLRGLNDSKQVRPELRLELARDDQEPLRGLGDRRGHRRRNRPAQHLLGLGAGDGARASPRAGCAIDYLLTDAVRIRSFTGPARAGDQGRRQVRHASPPPRSWPRCTGTASSWNSTGSTRSTVLPNTRDTRPNGTSKPSRPTAPAPPTGGGFGASVTPRNSCRASS